MRRTVTFGKYHGCGNDFIIVDETRRRSTDRQRSNLAKLLCDRNFQIGADGIIFLEKTKDGIVSMRLFEPAGNEADMCGNGIRCVAAFVGEKSGKRPLQVLTRDGVKHIVPVGTDYAVEMGVVRTLRKDLRRYITDKGRDSDSMLSVVVRAGNRKLKGALVNSGEPHFVTRVRRVDALDVADIGDRVNRNTRRFPKGVNLDFVELLGRRKIRIRTYERGVYDETLSCGTGATASAAVAIKHGWVDDGPVEVITSGGTLRIDLEADGTTVMTGSAVHVFDGRVVVNS